MERGLGKKWRKREKVAREDAFGSPEAIAKSGDVKRRFRTLINVGSDIENCWNVIFS